jgi:hypothetical protein
VNPIIPSPTPPREERDRDLAAERTERLGGIRQRPGRHQRLQVDPVLLRPPRDLPHGGAVAVGRQQGERGALQLHPDAGSIGIVSSRPAAIATWATAWANVCDSTTPAVSGMFGNVG